MSLSVSSFFLLWIMTSFICNNSFIHYYFGHHRERREKVRGNNNSLLHVLSKRKEEIKSGISLAVALLFLTSNLLLPSTVYMCFVYFMRFIFPNGMLVPGEGKLHCTAGIAANLSPEFVHCWILIQPQHTDALRCRWGTICIKPFTILLPCE